MQQNVQQIIEGRDAGAVSEKKLYENIFAVAPGVWRMKDIFVNVFIVQDRTTGNWILIDTGLQSSAPKIRKMIARLIEPGARPSAIVMTHGHFDHRGALKQLTEEWQVPVYAHVMEMPYLTGKCSYPPPDPTVGGGGMAAMAFIYPKKPIDVSEHLLALPDNGNIPEMPEWRWIYTPGHSPGHISLFRERDGVLIAGDALVTTRQESILSVMTQKKVLCGPPRYFTPDWGAATRSVKELKALEPGVIASGHGPSMYGETARKALHHLVRHFWKKGIPEKGRYVKEPARFTEEGVSYIPPAARQHTLFKIAIVTVLIGVGCFMLKRKKFS